MSEGIIEFSYDCERLAPCRDDLCKKAACERAHAVGILMRAAETAHVNTAELLMRLAKEIEEL